MVIETGESGRERVSALVEVDRSAGLLAAAGTDVQKKEALWLPFVGTNGLEPLTPCL